MSEYQSLIDELESTLPFSDAARRTSLLQRISDFFVSGSSSYTDEQLGLFDDVLIRLTADIEEQSRAALSERFATLKNAPPQLIRQLAFDDAIAVAAPVLAHSEQLSDADLVENASTKSQDHLYAIAQRLSLSEAVTDVLVARGEPRVVRTTARNRGARFSSISYDRLVEQARKDGGLALAMGRRNDIPRQYFIKLLEAASASVRKKLLEAAPTAEDEVNSAIEEIAGAMRKEVRETSPQYAAALRDLKHRYSVQGITEADVHAAARAQQFERAVIALSTFANQPIDLIERAMLDSGVGMILTIAKAAGCSWVTAKALLVMQAAKRELSAEDLQRACDSFDRLRPGTATRVLKFHEKRTKLPMAAAKPAKTAALRRRV